MVPRTHQLKSFSGSSACLCIYIDGKGRPVWSSPSGNGKEAWGNWKQDIFDKEEWNDYSRGGGQRGIENEEMKK